MSETLALVPMHSSFVNTDEKRRIFSKLFSLFSLSSDSSSSTDYSSSSNSQRGNKNFKKGLYFFIPIAIIVIALVIILGKLVASANHKAVAGASDSRVNIEKPIATQTLNKSFDFPLKDDTGKQVSSIKMTFTTAELRDEIIVKGEKATAVDGRTFLILNLKLTNNYNKSVQINTRDYVRLSVNNSDEKLAADIHNDPVEVQAISTKYTRLGFPINDTDKHLVLHIGEINGSKQDVQLHLQ